MNTHMIRTLAAVALASLGTLSCSGANETQASSPAKPVAEAPQPPILAPGDAAIPSQEEADQAAEKAINDANADAEMEKLEKELESGGGGG
jgi:hypothetical protein